MLDDGISNINYLLITYGKKIYNEKTYDKIEKYEDETYFISINNLKAIYKYDISKQSSKCNFSNSGIKIDLNSNLYPELNIDPIFVILDCKKN